MPRRDNDLGQVILVVEDDDRVREMTISMLRELGYIVLHAEGAEAALRRLAERPEITLLFTDVVMPDMSGRDLAIESLRRRPDLKVLFTTGFARDAILQAGTLQQGLNFIPKPFTLEQLALKITSVLASGRVTSARDELLTR